ACRKRVVRYSEEPASRRCVTARVRFPRNALRPGPRSWLLPAARTEPHTAAARARRRGRTAGFGREGCSSSARAGILAGFRVRLQPRTTSTENAIRPIATSVATGVVVAFSIAIVNHCILIVED